MGTINVSSVVSKAQIILQDTTGIRWPELELLGWLNDGQRDIAVHKPNAFVKNVSHSLAVGTKQTLPGDGVLLIDIVRNLPNGRAVRIVMREILDAQIPNWHSAPASGEIKHYTYSHLDPKTFYVYPPSNGGNNVELVYGAAPTEAALGGTITLDDIYATALLDYVLYRGYSKDTEYAADQNRSANHYAAYIATVSGKASVEGVVNPNMTAPANPNITPNSR
ncbi:MAG: DUF6682 family protein [Porticoccaceae bacterium]